MLYQRQYRQQREHFRLAHLVVHGMAVKGAPCCLLELRIVELVPLRKHRTAPVGSTSHRDIIRTSFEGLVLPFAMSDEVPHSVGVRQLLSNSSVNNSELRKQGRWVGININGHQIYKCIV